jgi:hypothetical protein
MSWWLLLSLCVTKKKIQKKGANDQNQYFLNNTPTHKNTVSYHTKTKSFIYEC